MRAIRYKLNVPSTRGRGSATRFDVTLRLANKVNVLLLFQKLNLKFPKCIDLYPDFQNTKAITTLLGECTLKTVDLDASARASYEK